MSSQWTKQKIATRANFGGYSGDDRLALLEKVSSSLSQSNSCLSISSEENMENMHVQNNEERKIWSELSIE